MKIDLGKIKKIFLSGIKQFRDYPQLWFTTVVAVAIFVSFLYTANLFIGIAKDAGDRLINTRIGSLQDAFAPLASEVWGDRDALRKYAKTMVKSNTTIVDFDILVKKEEKWIVVTSLNKEKENTNVLGFDRLLNLAESDIFNSYTAEEANGGERFFRTVRAVVSDNGEVIAVLMT